MSESHQGGGRARPAGQPGGCGSHRGGRQSPSREEGSAPAGLPLPCAPASPGLALCLVSSITAALQDGILSCPHHHQQPQVGLPAFSVFSCRPSLRFYCSALSQSRIESWSCGSRVPNGFHCYKAPSESPGRCRLSSSPCVFSAAGASPSVPVRTPVCPPCVLSAAGASPSVPVRTPVCLPRPVRLPLLGGIPALLPTRRLPAPLGWLSSFPGRKSLSVSVSPSRHNHTDVSSPSLSFTSPSPSGGRGLRLFNLCSQHQAPRGVLALDVC